MAVFVVTFDGTRFSVVDSYTNWGNYGGSGAGGAAESPIAYQNALAANRKQSTTGGALGGIDYDPGAGALDHTGATRRLVFTKTIISDSFDCNTSEGLRVTVGSSSANTRKYNMAGSTATNDAYLKYPPQGGYVLTAIDVTVAFWAITTTGTFDDTAVDYYGVQGSWITGQAKAENIAMDAIDVGTGLYLVGGTAGDPIANFVSYVEIDQNITTNRWGCVSGAGANVNAWCVLRAGGAIEFFDTTSVVSFKDGYHSAGLTGILHELDTAASTFTMGALLIGEGKLYNSGAIDTRPDYIITGTTITSQYNLTGEARNFRNITLTSKVDAIGARLECELLTQASANIENCVIKTNALASIACLQDPTFGTTTDLHDVDFIQTANTLFSTAYFDGSDVAASDAGSDWTQVTRLDDGDDTLYASVDKGGTGTSSVATVEGTSYVGTQAVLSVKVRIYQGSSSSTGYIRTTIYDGATSLGFFDDTLKSSGSTVSSWYTIPAPSGGWTGDLVRSLKMETYSEVTVDLGAAFLSLIEIEVEYSNAGHAIELSGVGTTYDFTNLSFTGYGPIGSDDAALDITAASGTTTINISGGTIPTYKTAGATVELVSGAVPVLVTAQDSDATVLQNVRVLIEAGSGGAFPSDASVTLTSVTTTATVAHTAHGMSNGDKVVIRGAVENNYNGIHTISNVSTNAYDYTIVATTSPATGTILSTFVILEGLTDINGEITITRTYSIDTPLSARSVARKATGSPLFKEAKLVGAVDKDVGLSLIAIMTSDE